MQVMIQVTMRLTCSLAIVTLSLLHTVSCHLACGPRMSPRMLMDIPCDLDSSSYCQTAGSSYPWTAVRRYIYDNQAVMRQMYGDHRQSYIIQNEIEELRERFTSIDFSSRKGKQLMQQPVESNVTSSLLTDEATNTTVVEEENETTITAEPVTEATSQATTKTSQVEAKRGFQACQVKEEIISPYWAKNVQGEPYPIVNVFPFDQYIHAEKCDEEFSPGFCHEGCRCEQRYRLHRLLAYDIKNQCRGIFSDWFRFPSSCICICYDVPQVTSVTSPQKRVSRRKGKM